MVFDLIAAGAMICAGCVCVPALVAFRFACSVRCLLRLRDHVPDLFESRNCLLLCGLRLHVLVVLHILLTRFVVMGCILVVLVVCDKRLHVLVVLVHFASGCESWSAWSPCRFVGLRSSSPERPDVYRSWSPMCVVDEQWLQRR